MKFNDLENRFECPEWQDEEIETVKDLLKNRLPLIPVEFDGDYEGIFIGVGGECVKIENTFIDRNGNELYKPRDNKNKFYCYPDRPLDDEEAVVYKGKVYTGYRLIVGGCYISGCYKSLSDVASAAIAVYETMIFTKHEHDLPISLEADQEFSLGK